MKRPRLRIRRCDSCGALNPRNYEGNARLCGEDECLSTSGFYKTPGHSIGTNGKIGWWTLQIPIRIQWRGWWTLWRDRSLYKKKSR